MLRVGSSWLECTDHNAELPLVAVCDPGLHFERSRFSKADLHGIYGSSYQKGAKHRQMQFVKGTFIQRTFIIGLAEGFMTYNEDTLDSSLLQAS